MAEFVDLRTYDGPEELACDVCVAGAGAAGITLARALTASGLSVVLLESGGLDLESDTQRLYAGTNTGMRYLDLTACRLRFFGGTTNHWGGFTQFGTPLDFSGMPAAGLPAWPIERSDLLEYGANAARMLDTDFALFDPAEALRRTGYSEADLVEAQSSELRTIVYPQARRRRFATEFRSDLEAGERLQVFLYANLTHIQLMEAGTAVDHFVVRSLEGKRLTIRANAHVLACHAIENARLLMASNDVQPAGIGNASDQLGRNFMDHVYLRTGRLLSGENRVPDFYLRGTEQRGDPDPERKIDFVIALSDDARRREQMLSYYMNFEVVYADELVYQAVSHLRNSFFSPFDRQTFAALTRVVGEMTSAVRIAQEEMRMRPRKLAYLGVSQRIDQAPNPQSRVTLTRERDALGVPKINLHWDVTELDVRSFQRGQELMMRELSARGFGRFALESMSADVVRENLVGHNHHLGTTRMSAAARDGVVDADCRVHGVRNLYVAGSSTFPTGGSTGPTLMIVAMALRLADRLAREGGR